jgi:sugar phosphate isomerase/epimerase
MLAPRGEDYSSIPRIRETGGLRPDATWADNLKLAMGVARAAATLGLRLVTFHAGFIPHDARDPLHGRMIERLRAVADVFAEEGVDVAFETGQESAECLVEALQALDRPTVGVNFDPANMLLYGAGDPLQGFRRLRQWVRQVHAKDAVPSGQPDVWGRETPVGAGAVPWREFMAEVRSLPPEVAVVIEREGGERRVQEVASAREFLQPML